ncbi:hypothetical protein KIN20_000016 [Parelaphostrongylus tenuis]|uniref:Uncharacterized protein n=1 Tax=Parelaphostrongylus tenuis TaxID=148309 RepID=A0AAD5LUS2_PARTN|nr:hypothetical protein KIN20_000016 [Parelaphostrongylus tenuis]
MNYDVYSASLTLRERSHILGQIAMIFAQLVAVAFTITVRKRLHLKLEKEWQKRSSCKQPSECLAVKRFLQSETLLILILCIFLLLQAVLFDCEHCSLRTSVSCRT